MKPELARKMVDVLNKYRVHYRYDLLVLGKDVWYVDEFWPWVYGPDRDEEFAPTRMFNFKEVVALIHKHAKHDPLYPTIMAEVLGQK